MANSPTEPQMFSAEQQGANADLVRRYIENHGNPDEYFSDKARIWIDSRPSTCSVVFEDDVVFIGPDGMRDIGKRFSNIGYSYDIQIHDVYTCGPVVVVNRTDTRKEEGKADIPIPAVGVFAVRDGKLIQWSDYFR